MYKNVIPSENIEIYCMLYQIETALHELIIELMENKEGQKWYITHLPGDILEKYRKAKDYERKIKWSHSTPMHPIYYIDFTDLEKIIVRNDNWQNAFIKVFKRKEIITDSLKELELIRNKVAHNRKANTNDVKITKVALIKISECIGCAEFKMLVKKSTSEPDIINHVRYLEKEALDTYKLCIPNSFNKYFAMWKAEEISATDFAKLLEVSRSAIFRYINEHEAR